MSMVGHGRVQGRPEYENHGDRKISKNSTTNAKK